MQVSSSYCGKISYCDGCDLFLVNGVASIGESKIAIADGGNDRLCLYDVSTDNSISIGTKGFGRYSFTEPIGVFSADETLYVTDWHNHRVVVFTDSLEYVTEVGHYGDYETFESSFGKLRHLVRFLRNFGHNGIYFRNHLDPENNDCADGLRFSLRKLASSLRYWYERNNSLTEAVAEIFEQKNFFNKPNGVVQLGEEIYVTQKDNGCITVFGTDSTGTLQYRRKYDSPVGRPKFGRLCNLSKDNDGTLYVCEQNKGRIYHLTSRMECIETITGDDMGTGEFIPFSCIPLGEQLIIAGGGFEFQMINRETNEVVYHSRRMGEVHGLAYDKHRSELFVADRSESCVHRFALQVK